MLVHDRRLDDECDAAGEVFLRGVGWGAIGGAVIGVGVVACILVVAAVASL